MGKQKKILLLFSHTLTPGQEDDANRSLGITDILNLPAHLQKLWSNIPAAMESIEQYLLPVEQWIKKYAGSNDYILIQGDFGATYLMVRFAFEKKLIPVYATSERKAFESVQEDGAVKMEHLFKFCRFRRYGV